MRKYEILEMYTDGYERFARVKEIMCETKMNVHFVEFQEYVEEGEKSKKKKVGDIIEGEIFIDLVSVSRKEKSNASAINTTGIAY